MPDKMPRIFCAPLALCFLLVACNRAGVVNDDVYGSAEDTMDAVPVEAVLAEPGSYTGNQMSIAGTVHEVCQMNGCWLMLRSAETEAGLRVHTEMTDNGEYKFTVPKDISGRRVVAFGRVDPVDAEAHYQRDAPGTRVPMLSMTANGVRVLPEQTR